MNPLVELQAVQTDSNFARSHSRPCCQRSRSMRAFTGQASTQLPQKVQPDSWSGLSMAVETLEVMPRPMKSSTFVFCSLQTRTQRPQRMQ